MSEPRVVVTGIGVVSALGLGRSTFWEALCAGHSGIRPITRFPTAGLNTHLAAWVADFDMTPFAPVGAIRRLDWPTRLSVAAAHLALADASLTTGEGPGDLIGLVLNTALGPVSTNEKYLRSLIENGPREASPLLFPATVTNGTAGYVAMLHRLRGASSVVVGSSAVGYAADLIRLGHTECMLAGGFEELTPTSHRIASELGLLAHAAGKHSECSRPYDRRRNGFVVGEGAAILVLERLEHAQQRVAPIYAEVAGYACIYDPSFDPQSQFRSLDAACLTATVNAALDEAGCQANQIDAVMGLAQSTSSVDRAEALMLHRVFGPRAAHLPVSAIKGALGETLGLSDTLGVACAALALHSQMLPPTLHCEQPDPDCGLDGICPTSRPLALEHILCTALEFGGNNSACVLQRYPDTDT